MEKITRFRDVPQFTKYGNWQCDYDLVRFVSEINRMVNEDGLQLNPDFQRGNVWTEEQQISYVEFLLKGGKTARVIYLNYPSWSYNIMPGDYNEFVCVDGLQRISALKNFVGNKIKVFGSYFNEYKDTIRIMSDVMKININDLKTRKEVLQWYVDFNSGGTIHTSDEIERVKQLIMQET